MEDVNPLGEEKISKLLVKFSVPAIVGMMVNALYNIVDRIFIGNSSDLGTYGLAGITIAFPIMIILLAIGILFGVGGATLFSIRLGEKQKESAENVMGNAFVLLVITGFIFMLLGQIFLKPILSLFGASEAVLPYSMEYMRVIFFGAIFQVVSIGMNNFIRADGNPKIAMMTMFLGAGVNILLDPLFIYVFKMGMAGAAFATILAQAISATWVVLYFIGKRSRNKLRLKHMKLKFDIVIKITSLGLPGFSMQLANSLLNMVLNKSLFIYGGDIAVSGMGVINSIQTMLLMPIIGLNQGVQPIISFNYGAKKYNRIKTAIKLAIIVATMIVVCGYIITRLFPKQMIAMFNQERDLLDFGSYALISWFLCFPVVGFQIISSNFFQAIGRPKSSMFLVLSRQIILLIPAIIIFPKFWGMNGLLHAAPFADFLSALLTGVWFYKSIKTLEESKCEGTVDAADTPI
ncbi:MATE family efflux transporter [Clostridium tetanomorphum]|uniref:Multidrug export protein MepA n=1 Tax=Clostridium tetanomorphum TaxID=1553 RepID=A0A923J362_CLOTT|nr:MATE family efflux transporter [Clostridium tetanomorphum]MBC2399743.1 MATE family efflux transporter [Clostridium tetanomorphum]NRZ96915.1 putative MATE family efflux protein [Clostridium tetanomorphum]